jgi:hypothetical protein
MLVSTQAFFNVHYGLSSCPRCDHLTFSTSDNFVTFLLWVGTGQQCQTKLQHPRQSQYPRSMTHHTCRRFQTRSGRRQHGKFRRLCLYYTANTLHAFGRCPLPILPLTSLGCLCIAPSFEGFASLASKCKHVFLFLNDHACARSWNYADLDRKCSRTFLIFPLKKTRRWRGVALTNWVTSSRMIRLCCCWLVTGCPGKKCTED